MGESCMHYCKRLRLRHSVVGEILTAIVTTVRSAKAVITTFCRMLSCEGGERRDKKHMCEKHYRTVLNSS